jgi:hypothetical protein
MSSLRRRRLTLVAAAVAVVVGLLAVYFVPFHLARGSSASGCRTLSVAARVPSVAMDDERGVAYLAYLDVTKQSPGRVPRGTIMLMDLNAAEPRVRAALVTEPPDFQPGAIGLYTPTPGPRRLFVVDHESAVQIFEQSASGAFERVKTVQDPQFANLAEIEPASAGTFYVLSRPQGWFGKWRASAMFYDGAKTAATTKAFRERSGVYVSDKTRMRLEVIERDDTTDLQLCPAPGVTPSS